MKHARVVKMELKQEPNAPPKFIATIIMTDQRKVIIDDIIHLGPVTNTNLLVITRANGETIVYVLNQNIEKYSFQAVK